MCFLIVNSEMVQPLSRARKKNFGAESRRRTIAVLVADLTVFGNNDRMGV